MVVLHYAGISKNNASGVSVVVPQILNSQSSFAEVGFYNYGKEHFETNKKIVCLNSLSESDDYHSFPEPFNRPDIVIFHSPFGIMKSVGIAKKLKKDNIPYVVVPHGCFSRFAMQKKKIKKIVARILFLDKMIKNSCSIQYLSEGERLSSVYKKRNFIIPNGIEIPECCKKEKNEILEITFIGRKDVYHKGLDVLINACGIAKEKLKGHAIVNIFGPGSEEQMANIDRLIAENEVEDLVINKPAVFEKDKRDALLNTDIFVLTSRFEGQPVAVLESWAYGVPTLVTPGTNVADECKTNKCGWKIEMNANDIASKLKCLVENREEINQYAQNAYEYVRRMYSWEKVANKYYEAYLKICR